MAFLIWLWLTIIILYLFIGQIGLFYFLLPEDLILLTEAGKIFFIIFGLPLLFKPTESQGISFPHRLWVTFRLMIIFFLIFLPVTISGTIIASLDWRVITMGHLLMMIIGCLIIGLSHLSTYLRFNLWRWYYLIILTITAVLPLLYYLIAELFNQFVPALLYINPFWLVWRLDEEKVFYQGWMLQVIICLVLIIGLIGITQRLKPR